MNYVMIGHLIRKDWFLQRGPLAGTLVGGVVSAVVLYIPGKITFFMGSILVLTTLLVIGAHVALSAIVNERKEQNLPFIMSLPITILEYTAAKIASSLLIVGVAWLAVLAGTMTVIVASPALPDGMLPYTAIVLTEVLMSSSILVSVALISESVTWTSAALVCGNVFINLFLFHVSREPEIAKYMNGNVPVWNSTAIAYLGGELLVMTLCLAAAFYVQSRKTDFI